MNENVLESPQEIVTRQFFKLLSTQMTGLGLYVDTELLEDKIEQATYLANKFQQHFKETYGIEGLKPTSKKDSYKVVTEFFKIQNAKMDDCIISKMRESSEEPIQQWGIYGSTVRKIGTLKGFKKLIGQDGKIYPQFHDECSTSRIYIAQPNLQGSIMDIRDCIIPGEGKKFLYADYQSQELRILMGLCGMHLKEDVNALDYMATQLGLSEEASREWIKMVVYGISYGSKFYGHLENENGDPLLRAFEKAIPGFDLWVDKVIRDTILNGGILLLPWGLVRKVPEILENKGSYEYEKGQRLIVNTWIQGLAAYMLKLKAIELENIHNMHPTMKWQLKAVVHDAYLYEVSADVHDYILIGSAKEILSYKVKNMPIPIRAVVGNSWGECMREIRGTNDLD